MKNKLKYVRSYLPWLFVLFAIDLFNTIILWIADIKMLQALFLLFFEKIVIFLRKRHFLSLGMVYNIHESKIKSMETEYFRKGLRP